MYQNINGIFYDSIEPDTVLAGCINIYENVWPDSDQIIKQIESECIDQESDLSWSKALTIQDGLNQSARTNYVMSITDIACSSDSALVRYIHNQTTFILNSALMSYAQKYNIDTLYNTSYDILKYCGGQEYKNHYDGSTNTGRVVSAIIYLNNDYDGGEIEFVNFGIKIKPEPGMLIIFPSNYAYSHIAHPVVSGTKYAIVTWFTDREINE